MSRSKQHLGEERCWWCPFPGCEQCPHPGGHDPNGDTPPLWEEP